MTSETQQARRPCLVCDAQSIGVNFGVPTCMACKAFFRRNAVKLGNYEFVCLKDGDCPIDHPDRRLCNCCRLAKCFHVGMQKALILTDSEKEARRQIVEQNRLKRGQLMKMKFSDLNQPPNIVRITYGESNCLSSSDQALLTNIYSAYQRTCIAIRKSHCPYFPTKQHSSLHSLLNEYHDRQESLIEYFKLVPEFKRLSMDDKIRLIKNHFGTMLSINESSDQPEEPEMLFTSLKNIYNVQLAMDLIKCVKLIKAYGYDPILLKLVLIVQSLSSGSSRYRDETDMTRIYDDTHLIFAGQSVYTELLWKYILLRLPSERDAVKFFNKLILDLLFIINVSFTTDSFVYSFTDEITRMKPLLQIIWPVSKQIEEIDEYDMEIKSPSAFLQEFE